MNNSLFHDSYSGELLLIQTGQTTCDSLWCLPSILQLTHWARKWMESNLFIRNKNKPNSNDKRLTWKLKNALLSESKKFPNDLSINHIDVPITDDLQRANLFNTYLFYI